MPKNIYIYPLDLISPDGKIIEIQTLDNRSKLATVEFEGIASSFKGFEIDHADIQFDIKNTLSQLGIGAVKKDLEFFPQQSKARAHVEIKAFTPIGEKLLEYIDIGLFIGKLFAADERRRVRKEGYLKRLLGKTDEKGDSLLLLNEDYKGEQIVQQDDKDRTIVHIPVQEGHYVYEKSIFDLLETIAKGLISKDISFRSFLHLHQKRVLDQPDINSNETFLLRSKPLSIRTLFARVASDELPKCYSQANPSVIEPRSLSEESFAFNGIAKEHITSIPLELYTLESFREHFFFSDRNLLSQVYEEPETLFKAFETAPPQRSAIFISKGEQFNTLTTKDWIQNDPFSKENLRIPPTCRKEQTALKGFIESQSAHTILKAMQEGHITSHGIILSSHFVAPILKSFLLNERVTRCLRAIYFKTPSATHGDFFSHEDRSLLHDLAKASVDVYWVDFKCRLLLKHVLRTSWESGMFVPIEREQDFKTAVFFGIYGSSLQDNDAKGPLIELFKGLLEMKKDLDHELFNPEMTIAISTGGGPGAMATGNQIANELEILSCGHAVDFSQPDDSVLNQEEMNPYIQAKMTYRLEQLVVRQSEFRLDFPILLTGGVGTDFELALEKLRTQVGNKPPGPILLFGDPNYWRAKISSTYHTNLRVGTIRGSEWVSNTFFVVQTAKQALSVYFKFFTNQLPIGKDYPPAKDGFFDYTGTLD